MKREVGSGMRETLWNFSLIYLLEGIGNQKTLAFENYLVTRMEKAQNTCQIFK